MRRMHYKLSTSLRVKSPDKLIVGYHCIFEVMYRCTLYVSPPTNTPLDLQTVTERLRSGYYSCLRLFLADMRRIFNNCKTFNERNTDYYRSAIALEKFYINKMKEAGIWMEMS